MNTTITAENGSDYLFIVTKGEVESAENLIAHADLIYKEFMKYKPGKMLIYEWETSFPLRPSCYVEVVNHCVDNFSNEALTAKVAVVINDKYKEIGEFWETVSTNRGFWFHAFTDLTKAKRWLLA